MTNQLLCKYKAKSGFIYVLIAFFAFIFASNAQSVAVSGTVYDNSGPLPGVSVIVKGTNVGTATDFDGNYTINAPSDAILLFSYVGFNNQEVPVNGQSVINVTLTENLEQLGEVVVVGYGVQRKEAVTGSVASIRGEVMRDVPSSNISQALQGRLPGVEFAQTSSKPGAAMQIRVRGSRSVSADNAPLIVLDGIPFSGSISDLNPNDIEGIDVLKDASATAIYGSRGANGVIMVTTNRGKKGQEAKITYNSFYGLKNVFSDYDMMNGDQLTQLRIDANSGYYDAGSGTVTLGTSEQLGVNTNWQDLFYRTGIITSHDVSLSGGTEKGNYSFNIGYHKDEAVVPIQQYERFSLRAAIDQEVGKSIKFGFTTNNSFGVYDGNDVNVGGVLDHSPLVSQYDEEGNLRTIADLPIDTQWVSTRANYDALGDSYFDKDKVFASYNNLYAEVKIPGIEGLKYRANLGLNYRVTKAADFIGTGARSPNPLAESVATLREELNTRWLIENIVSYDRVFNDKHEINLVGLYSAEETEYTKSTGTARGIISDHLQHYNLSFAEGNVEFPANTFRNQFQGHDVSGLMSWMGRAMYSYDNRYMISATVRSDGSSRLSEGNKWHTYPAISVGWNIGNENFVSDAKWMNQLKLRLGYGETSNQSIDPYATLGLLSTLPYNFGTQETGFGYYVTQLPNETLGWEYSTTYNVGLDFGFLNNRISGTFEYYVTDTNDILLSLGLPRTSGVNSYTGNIGSTQNKGWEISLNAAILDNPDGLTWDLGFNLYSNHNEITSLASGQERDTYNGWFVGKSINSIYDYKKIGLWQEGDLYQDILEPGRGLGMIKVEYTGQYNSDGSPVRAINGEDRQAIELDPDFQGGFNTRFGYKGFDLSAIGVFRSGGVAIGTLYGPAAYRNLMSGRRGNVDVDYWTPENTDARFPNPAERDGDNVYYASTMNYFDGSYLKIRTISLGYTFQNDVLENLGLDHLRLYFTAQNPFVFFSEYHDLSGMDPETNSLGDENGGDYRNRILTIGVNTPTTRNYLLGLNVTF